MNPVFNFNSLYSHMLGLKFLHFAHSSPPRDPERHWKWGKSEHWSQTMAKVKVSRNSDSLASAIHERINQMSKMKLGTKLCPSTSSDGICIFDRFYVRQNNCTGNEVGRVWNLLPMGWKWARLWFVHKTPDLWPHCKWSVGYFLRQKLDPRQSWKITQEKQRKLNEWQLVWLYKQKELIWFYNKSFQPTNNHWKLS